MKQRLDCPIFHEFDGQCCGEDEPCLCRPEPDPIVRAFILDRHIFLVIGVMLLVPVLLGGVALVDNFTPLTK